MKKGILTVIILILLITGAFAELQDISGTTKTNYRSAKMYFNQQIFEKAIPLYEEVLNDNPYHIESLMSLSGIYYEIDKDYIKAHGMYNRVLEAIEMVYGEYEEIKADNEKAGKKYYKKYIKKADLEEIEDKAVTLLNNCWTLLFQKGFESYKSEEYQSSLELFLPLLEIAPDSVKTVKMIANNYFKLEDRENGIKYYEMAYEKEPDNEETARLIAYNYLQLEEKEKAIEWYQKAVEVNPQNADNYYNIGVVHNDLSNLEEALGAFEKVIELEPENIDALYNAKILSSQMGDLDKFVIYSGMEFDVTGYDLAGIKVFCYQLNNMEAYEYVLEYGQKCAELDPSDQSPYQLMLVAANKLGKKDLALEYQKKLQEME